MYVLDTNTVIYFLRGLGRVGGRLLATPPAEMALPAFVLFELEVGVRKATPAKARRRQLEDSAAAFNLLPFDEKADKAAAELRIVLVRRGEPIGSFDTLIAGTVLASPGGFVTDNAGEFGRVPGLRMEGCPAPDGRLPRALHGCAEGFRRPPRAEELLCRATRPGPRDLRRDYCGIASGAPATLTTGGGFHLPVSASRFGA